MSNRPPLRKYGLGILLTIFSLVTIFGSVAFVQPAKAQFAVTTLTDIPRMLGDLGNKIKEGLKGAVMGAVQKSVSYFMRKVAYDSAVWLASGGKGQSPFANTSGFKDYMENVAGDAFGEAIAALGGPFGLDLCKVPDVKVDLAIKIGLRIRAGEPAKSTNCNWENFKKGWGKEAWKSKYGSVDALQKQFNISLKADPDADLGIYLQSVQKIDNIVSARTESAKLERQEGQGFKDFTTLISGAIKTPAQLQKLQAEANHPSKQQEKSEAQINAAFASGMFNILPQTLGLFLDTLASQMVKNFKENGMFPFGVCIGEYGGDHCKTIKYQNSSVASYEGSGIRSGGREAAQAAFSQLLVPSIKSLDKYNILAQLENCPEEAPATYNCRIDGDFVAAIQEATYGKPVTIIDAINKGWIHKDWKLLGPDREENKELNCKDSAYCYTNIKVLRQVRILPLGFEIAALNSPPDNPWTVEQVVYGFNDCATNENGDVVYDPVGHPFCHLVDPNWILKVEPAKCNSLVSGASPMLTEAPQRIEDCVDLSTCVAYNKDGTCLSYSYCIREKNVWRFDANKCDAQYSTCKAFKDSTGKDVAYLHRTLDTSYCSEGTAGCAAFSLNQDSDGNWLEPEVNLSSQYFNNGIHFNNKVSTSCGSDSQGCSAFKVSATKDVLYLRKAPDYLNCYDSDLTTNGIQWPKNNADLSKMAPKTDCSLYSGVCTAQEVGCNLFTSLLTAEEIPGKFKAAEINNGQVTWNDQCDAKCNGYAAYREMPNNYSNGRNIAYIIPSSGNTCAAADEGCSSFTNMGEISAGGEKVEYYSYLRPCIKPDTNKQKNFYTYEGSKEGGYQLKSYVLEKAADGSPKYWYKVAGDLGDYNTKCNEASYKAGLSDPDCRQFNDELGNVYYALLSKTIVVNNSCTYYRLNSSELAGAGTCFQNGEYKDGFCYYYGLPQGVATTGGSSRSCSASAESCFAYKGNTANNVKEIFKDTFENTNQTVSSFGWSGGTYTAESTHYGEHSLGYSGSASLVKSLSNVTVGRTYVLTFWAKGTASNVTISLDAGASSVVGGLNTSDVWQYYSFSPVELNGNTSTANLVFSGINGKDIFLDNIRLVEVTDYLYLVRNSLKVDPVCDSNLNDNLPGEALGCTGYSVKGVADTYYLTNFSYLCRTGAVGCTAVLDTYNTLENEKPDAYNVWIAGAAGTRSITMADGKSFSCVVLTGASGCYTNISGYTQQQIEAAGGAFNSSTVYVPGDTPASTPIYLVATAANACNAIDLGCTFAGAKSSTASGVKYNTVTVKNDPTEYKNNLCQSQAVGCNAYSSGASNYYFKDPSTTGQKICVYKSGIKVGGNLSSGWYWKGVGKCSSSESFCASDSDCGNGRCENVGSMPCYPDYVKEGSNYDLWSFGDVGKYQNFVGECPVAQSDCTEFVDNNDKDQNNNGKSYYYIKNSSVNSGDCDGQVSLKEGCVLFDQKDKPGKIWDTAASYLQSEKNGSKKIAPISGGNKDANVIIKVARDRECGEWLECRQSKRIWNDSESKWNKICSMLGRCEKIPENPQDQSPCASYIDEKTDIYYNKILYQRDYVLRDTSWGGMDFSGYYLFGQYQADELIQKDISDDVLTEDWQLVKRIPCGKDPKICLNPLSTASDNYECKDDASGKICGRNGVVGICKNGLCVQNFKGGTDFELKENILSPICRAYPEVDSPFPFTEQINRSKLFSGVNFCNENVDGVPTDNMAMALRCDCDYTKATYGDGSIIKYFNLDDPNRRLDLPENGVFYDASAGNTPGAAGVPQSICQGGERANEICSKDDDCGPSGSCIKKKKETKVIGWRGYCLELDQSRVVWSNKSNFGCLTWLPVGRISGYKDINAQNIDAGYVPPGDGVGGRYYCTEASSVMGTSKKGEDFQITMRGSDEYIYNTLDEVKNELFFNTKCLRVDKRDVILEQHDVTCGLKLPLNDNFACSDDGEVSLRPDYCRMNIGPIVLLNEDIKNTWPKWKDDLIDCAVSLRDLGSTLAQNQITYYDDNLLTSVRLDESNYKDYSIGCNTNNNTILTKYSGVYNQEIKISTQMGCDQDCGLDLYCITNASRKMLYDEPVYSYDKRVSNALDSSQCGDANPCGNKKIITPQHGTGIKKSGPYQIPNKYYSLKYYDYFNADYEVSPNCEYPETGVGCNFDNWFYKIKVIQNTDFPDYSCWVGARTFWSAGGIGGTPKEEEKIKQSDIEYIKFELTNGDPEDPSIGVPIYIYPNNFVSGKPLMSFVTANNNDRGQGLIVTGNLSGKESLPAFFYTSRVDTDDDSSNDENEGVFDSSGTFIVDNWKAATFNNTFKPLGGNLFTPKDAKANSLSISGERFVNDIAFFEGEKWNVNDICSASPNEQNWHGVVAQFDENTKDFLGYWMFYCDGSKGGGKAFYKVTFKLRENCRQIVDVNLTPYATAAVAQTNNIWQKNSSKMQNDVFSIVKYMYDTATAPYGSLNEGSLDGFFAPFKLKPAMDSDDFKMIYLTGADKNSICDESASDLSEKSEALVSCINENWKNSEGDVLDYLPNNYFGGAPYSCPDGNCFYTQSSDSDAVFSDASFRKNESTDRLKGAGKTGLDLLSYLFVKVQGVYNFDFNKSEDGYFVGYSKVDSRQRKENRNFTSGQSNFDYGSDEYGPDSFTDPSKAPKVLSVGECDLKGNCLEGRAGVTINGKQSGNVLIKASPATAVMNFFAYADGNQMPIRSVRVDWGDGEGKDESSFPSFFANARGTGNGKCDKAKGYCLLDGVPYPNSRCSDDDGCRNLQYCVAEEYAPDFGHILGRTCDTHYFYYEWTYNCVRGVNNWHDVCEEDKSNFPNGCCVFKPRVQVKDNWGWCNGNNGSGFYDGNDRSIDDQCLGDLSKMTNKAYTQFRGQILVAPQD